MASHQDDDSQAGLANASWYLLDAQDRLVDVCPEWDAVALAGAAQPGSLRVGVIGQPLRRFIAGDVTRMYMEAVLQSCRLTGQARSLPYRCDTPDLQREMEMRLEPLAQDALRVEHRLLSARPRARRLVVQTVPAGSARHVWRCSLCLRLSERALESPWLEDLPSPQQPTRVMYTICPDCRPRG
jgi:hypothetical protein